MKVLGREHGGHPFTVSRAAVGVLAGAGEGTQQAMRPGRQPPKAMGTHGGSRVENGLHTGGRRTRGEAEMGVGRQRGLWGGVLGTWTALSPGSENLGPRMGPGPPPASRTPRMRRTEGAGPPPCPALRRGKEDARTPRGTASDVGPRPLEPEGLPRRASRDEPPGFRDARGGEKPLPFHFLPDGGRNEVLGLRWGCSAPWRPRGRFPVPRARIGVCVPQRARTLRGGWGESHPSTTP